MRLIASLVALLATLAAHAQLLPAERQGIEETLFIGNLTLKDLEYERKPFSDPYRMALINLAIDKPLDAADRLMELHASSKTRSLSSLVEAAALQMGNLGPAPGPESLALEGDVSAIPPALLPPLSRLVRATMIASAEVRGATAQLTPDERRALIESLPAWAAEEPKITFDFVNSPALDQAAILRLLAKVDLQRIRRAAVLYIREIEATVPQIRSSGANVPGIVKLRYGGIPIAIGGMGPDIHDSTDALVTIDLGGDDVYIGRHGAGVGYASTLVDLGGDDRYEGRDLNVGAGLLGIGVAYDLGGNDQFRGRSLSYGAGLAGVGAFVKTGGNDLYSSVALSQGFGQFGIGVAVDTGGDDVYRAALFAQGAARTMGVGWLIDRGGDDIYRAGGLVVSAPLFADVHYSFGQGFASGYREDTGGISGGIGLLTDHAGDDAYLGETYAQAASYWFSVGSLYDAAGHDGYNGYHYVQASAMHICGAYLFDLAGDDAYSTKFGATHAIGHDYGVAFLLDRKGNDVYAARDSNPAVGNANGLAIFIDAEGEDRYHGPPAKGNAGRGTGSLAVFVDLSGQDRYREGLADAIAEARDVWGFAYDRETPPPAPGQRPTEPPPPPPPGSIPFPGDAQVANIYEKATQWGVGTAQAEVQANIRMLIGIGLPALQWMVDKRMARASRLEIRAFVQVATAVGEEGRNLVASRVMSNDENEARVALSVCIDGGFTEATPALAGALARPGLRRLAVRAAGVLRAREVVNELMPLTLEPDRLLALNATLALAQIGDEAGLSTAQALLQSPELPIRKAAMDLVAKFPDRAVVQGKTMAADDDERTARIGIELLGKVGSPEALAAVGEMLLDSRAGVRIQALQALNGRCPPEFRTNLIALRTDPIPAVRAVAVRVDPGR